MEKKELEETAAFLRQHRSNESNFATLYARLEAEIGKAGGNYKTLLQDVREKGAAEYRSAKESAGTAWPEFENFVSGFEKAVVEEMAKAK